MISSTYTKKLHLIKDGSTKLEVVCQQRAAVLGISPKVLNVDVCCDGAYLEMEKVEGETLFTMFSKDSKSIDTIFSKDLTLKLMKTLILLYKNIRNWNATLMNIMVNTSGEVYILDFKNCELSPVINLEDEVKRSMNKLYNEVISFGRCFQDISEETKNMEKMLSELVNTTVDSQKQDLDSKIGNMATQVQDMTKQLYQLCSAREALEEPVDEELQENLDEIDALEEKGILSAEDAKKAREKAINMAKQEAAEVDSSSSSSVVPDEMALFANIPESTCTSVFPDMI